MRDLSARMRSRGPDGSGYYGNEKFGLAHERLAIMDPEGGKQPIVYEDAKYSVCANGEIYNFSPATGKNRMAVPPCGPPLHDIYLMVLFFIIRTNTT